MTPQEAKQFLDEQKAQGHSEEEILAVLYSMFVDDSINIDQLEALVGAMGYRLTEEFKNMSPEDQKTKGWGEDEEPKAEENGEEAPKAEEPPAEEPAAKEEPKAEEAPAKEEPKAEENGGENEEEKAKKLFGLDK